MVDCFVGLWFAIEGKPLIMVGLKRWGPAIFVMLLIFAASATPSDDLPSFGILNYLIYKSGHMLGYALLATALLHGLSGGKRVRRSQTILAVLLTLAYAASDELHQTFTAGRHPSPVDVMIDGAGAVLGLIAWSGIRNRLGRNRRSART
jgi:VanZ family protein